MTQDRPSGRCGTRERRPRWSVMTITLAARRTTILATLFALFALTSAAHATFTSSISNGEVTMTGNGDSDILNLTPSGSLLAHDQIGGGFASAVDFNTAMAGNQTVTANNVGFSVTVNAGDGDDFVIVGAGNALQIVPAFTVNGGGGYDALYIDDRTDTTARTDTFTTTSNGDQVSTSNGRDYTHPDVEATLFRFGSGSDTANALGVAEQTVVAAEGNAGDDTFNFGSVLGGVGSI